MYVPDSVSELAMYNVPVLASGREGIRTLKFTVIVGVGYSLH